jgi:creatinine amidohydrolase
MEGWAMTSRILATIATAALAALTILPMSGWAGEAAPATNPLWRDGKIKNYLPYMSWPEVEALLKKSDMVIIPVGAMEQHGLGGPIGTDFLNGTQRALLVAQQTDVLVAPILLVGQSPYHLEFPGSIALSSETIQRVYFEAAQSLIKQGFRRFLFLNSHAGNDATTNFIVDRINQETSAIAVELGNAASLMRPPAATSNAPAQPRQFDRHGGVNETSASLYLTPGLYDQSVARPAKITYPPHLAALVPKLLAGDRAAELVFLREALKSSETGKHTSTREMTDTGSWSTLDPKNGTAEQGRWSTEAFVTSAVAFINHWKTLRPNGLK